MSQDQLEELIAEYVSKYGRNRLISRLRDELMAKPRQTLTIICDDTLHHIPDNLIVGETYVFSQGSFDTTSENIVENYLISKLSELHNLLKSKDWSSIRLIFTGHAILAASVKMMVYRTCHIETEDVVYFGSAGYRVIKIDTREILTKKMGTASK